MTQEELIEDLKSMTLNIIESAKRYKELEARKLNVRLSEDSWSILECFEHMNRYDAFYIEELKQKLAQSPDIGSSERWFRSGWIGGRSANSMLPKGGKLNKMKTFKKMNPLGSKLDSSVIDTFIKDQRTFLELLRTAKEKDLNKVRIKLTIPILKFKAGDAFRFVQNHNVRHLAQSKRIMDSIKG